MFTAPLFLHDNPALQQAVDNARLLVSYPPLGGHNNDGYYLVSRLLCQDTKQLIRLLDDFGVEYQILMQEKARVDAEVELDGQTRFIHYQRNIQWQGSHFDISIHDALAKEEGAYSLLLDFRTDCIWHNITEACAQSALAFEAAVNECGLDYIFDLFAPKSMSDWRGF